MVSAILIGTGAVFVTLGLTGIAIRLLKRSGAKSPSSSPS